MDTERKAIEIAIHNKKWKLHKSDPLPIEDAEIDQHLYNISGVFHRFFSGYTDTFIADLLSVTKKPGETYNDAILAIDKIIEEEKIDYLTKYEFLFQYRNLMRRLEQVKFDGLNSEDGIPERIKFEIQDYFNQARTTQNICFLNVVSTYSVKIPSGLRMLFASSIRRVAMKAVKYSMREMNRGLRSYFVCYDAADTFSAMDTVFAIRQALESKQYMPLNQEF